ncbi:LysM peptidoglycan-binding domain-containing protein [Nesterenkonia sp.]|uniref:LysM peptidoglycan-binding domain-containing protein n=1 Tax=Nesterenkonia sp. TaxID=704201 RepID=UPI0026356C21|nr:LysM peptidoglycan-binding domain-containing protein [Nesterenkonia sp.]
MTATANTETVHTSLTQHTAGLRLTRRGRLLLVGLPVMMLAIALLAGALFAATSAFNSVQATTAGQPGVEAVEVTVSPGDTLWTIASDAPAAGDIHQVMGQIVELNDLDSSQLQPGQVLHVPAD